jgi:hypothetical protein
MATFSLMQSLKIIEYNNYDKLNDIIINNRESIIKIYSSLIEKSIKYRSLECFDLLINMDINNINYEYKYCISLACLYYNNAPNMKNFYYLEKVVNKIISTNAKISINLLKEFINYPLMFSQLLNNIKLDEININFCRLLYHIINSNNNETFYILYNFIEDKNMINDYILKLAVDNFNIEIIEFLESKEYNINIIGNNNSNYSFSSVHDHKIPTLYYILIHTNNNILYKYFLNKETKNFSDIKKLDFFDICSTVFKSNNKIEIIEKYFDICKICSLEPDDIIITKLCMYILEIRSTNIYKNVSDMLMIIKYFLDTKKYLDNPFLNETYDQMQNKRYCLNLIKTINKIISKEQIKILLNIYLNNKYSISKEIVGYAMYKEIIEEVI